MRGKDNNCPSLTVQILASKKFLSDPSEKERYRLVVSDGKYFVSCAMLISKTGEFPEGLADFSIIKIDKYLTSAIESDGTNM